jgi:hypothetical protein
MLEGRIRFSPEPVFRCYSTASTCRLSLLKKRRKKKKELDVRKKGEKEKGTDKWEI